MKAFHFRLDQALRWRATSVDLEKSRVALAAGLVRQIRGAIEQHRTDLADGATRIASVAFQASGGSLALWAAFTVRSQRQIKELESSAVEAEKALSAQLELLVEANQRLQLLENLKKSAQSKWQAEFNRELEAFAVESYLFRLQSKR